MNVPDGFKQTEVGIIPQDWSVSSLGENITVNSGESPSKFKLLAYGIPYFKVDELNNSSKYAEESKYCIESSKSISEDSLIFPKRGASIFLNKIRILKQPSYMDTNLMTLTVSEKWDHEYIYYQLLYIGLWKVADTTSVPQINNKHIIPFQIPIPPTRAEQTAIATVLSDTDALIEGVEKLLEKKRWIKQGAMQELLKPKDGWKEIRLDSAADIDNDNLSSSSDPNFIFHYISLEDVDNGFLKGATEMIFKNAPSRARRCVKKGDVLVSTVRPNLKSHFLVKDDVENYICSTGFSLVRCDKEKLIPGYLFNHLFASFINQQIDSVISGSNYPSINTSHVKSLKIPIPTSIAEQERIAAILSDMDSEIEQLENQLAKYRKLKTGMMQELLTGKKRLL